jgi:GAF domain-containing protein
MTPIPLPQPIRAAFSEPSEPEAIFRAVLPAVCEMLQTDRCFLMVRNPQTRLYRIFCWQRSDEFPDETTPGWDKEQAWEQYDPLFAAALSAADSIFVEDVETAGAAVLNVEFERKSFGHRALIHAHLRQDGQLWGILEPCIFGHPRVWSEFDRSLTLQVVEQLTPIVLEYVKAAGV